MPVDPEILKAQQFYSPQMIRRLLPGLPTRVFQIAPQRVLRDRVKGDRPRWSWDEEQLCIACDLENALAALQDRSALHYTVVYRFGVLRAPEKRSDAGHWTPKDDPHSWKQIAKDTGHHYETIKRAYFDSIAFLAEFLGYEGDLRRWYEQGRKKPSSATVWGKGDDDHS